MSAPVIVPVSEVPAQRVAQPALPPGWWASALTLAERCALSGGPIGPVSPERLARAERRLGRWREEYWFGALDELVGRLAQTGLDEAGLRALLAEAPLGLAGRAQRPEWARLVEELVAKVPTEPAPPTPPSDGDAAAWAGLAAIVAPFAELAVDRLTAAIATERLGAVVDLESLRGPLVAQLERTLAALACRTLVLELHVLRETGRLVGATPRQRFWAFVCHFASAEGFCALLSEYPVLARLLAGAADRAAAGWVRLCRRLAGDRALLVDTMFDGTDPGRLVEAAFATGDLNDYRRATVLLRFAGGARLVYRPLPLGAYAAFGEVAGWLNRKLAGLELRPPFVVDRDEYGWVEFVKRRPCGGAAELELFHRRSGALLALLYMLDGAGFRSGDVVACGDQPVPVDLAGLCCPGSPAPGSTADTDPAQAAWEHSVRRVGVLPVPAGDDGWERQLGHRLGDSWLEWESPGTDQMRLRRPGSAPAGQTLHQWVGATPASPAREAALLAGFRLAYDALVAGRDELVGPGGLLWRFADAEVSTRIRSAPAYRAMLTESTHPDVMRDALDRDRVLGRLWTTPVGHPWERLIPAELAALQAGTYPSFVNRTRSREVTAGDGRSLPELLLRTGLARTADKISALGPKDRAAQEWVLRAWLAEGGAPGAATTTIAASPAGTTAGTSTRTATEPGIEPQRCLDSARRIADRLAEAAYRRGERTGWLGLVTDDELHWSVRPLGFDLYDGYPGVALFLAKLAELTGEGRYATLARRALAHVPALLDNLELAGVRAALRSGPFHGITGLAYALVHVAASLRDPSLRDSMVPPVAAAAMTTTGEELGVAGGAAGCVAAMLAVDAAITSPPARRVAQVGARRLVERTASSEEGATIGCPGGFAEGSAGIGWALLRHAAATGQPRSAEAGFAVLRRERDGLAGRGGWCRGAAGVGLALADILPAGDAGIAGDLDRALSVVVSSGPLADHSLCHGELGCLELLTVAASPRRSDLAAVRRRRAAGLLDALDRHGPRCGTPGGVTTPGLLTGLAGIGYGLLRLGFPDRVPSVLLLEPPRPAHVDAGGGER